MKEEADEKPLNWKLNKWSTMNYQIKLDVWNSKTLVISISVKKKKSFLRSEEYIQ